MEIHLNSKKEAYKFLTTSFSKRGLRNNLDKNQKTEKKGKKVIEKRKEGKIKGKNNSKKVFEMYFLIAIKYSSQFTHKKYVEK